MLTAQQQYSLCPWAKGRKSQPVYICGAYQGALAIQPRMKTCSKGLGT